MKKWYISFLVIALVMFTTSISAMAFQPGGVNTNAHQTQSNSVTNYGNTFNSDSRGFLNAPIISFPQMPNLFVNLPDGKNIRTLEQLLRIKPVWTRAELCALADGAKVKLTDGEALDGVVKSKEEKTDDDSITCLFGIPNNTKDMKLKAALFTAGKLKMNSFQNFAVMALKALDMGANVLSIETEGASHELYSKAAGFMIGGSVSEIRSDSAVIGTGGIGYSVGSAGYRSRPYHQGYAFAASNAKIKSLMAPRPIKERVPTANVPAGHTEPTLDRR